ncbi:MAG TPA: hypothetical protein VFU21_03505 [Kofleriaceae bacterium]|nr:hypothetical protein [Kofleriaceae bacterium]
MRRRPFISRALVIAALLSSLSAAAARPAQARSRARALAGKVSLGRAALPGRKGTATYLARLQRTSTGRAVFQEDRKTGEWTIHYAAVSARPLQVVRVKIYDISRGARLLGSHDQMLYRRSRILAGTLKLARDRIFSPNARLRIVFETLGGRLVAHRPFYIQGREQVRRRKRVTSLDFTSPDRPGGDRLSMESFADARRRRR